MNSEGTWTPICGEKSGIALLWGECESLHLPFSVSSSSEGLVPVTSYFLMGGFESSQGRELTWREEVLF